MSCLFCDQTPESVDAREKLATIAKLLNCDLANVIIGVQSILNEQDYMKQRQENIVLDRDNWRLEAQKMQGYARYREQEERMLPTHYTSRTNRWSSNSWDDPSKPTGPND